MEYVIEMLNIRKEFGNFVANDNITLQLEKGEIHALLGENGAGKSTLMNVLIRLVSTGRRRNSCARPKGQHHRSECSK